jgi:UDP-N-acetylmuramoyl-L-alanyl-D-glutamate--2,6-diaminopimelate ligase
MDALPIHAQDLLDSSCFLTCAEVVLALEEADLLSLPVPETSPLRRPSSQLNQAMPLIFDTRQIPHGPFVFVATKGLRFDSHQQVEEILKRHGLFVGSESLVVEHLRHIERPESWIAALISHPHLLLTRSSRQAQAVLLRKAFGLTESAFTTLAVTGTNGKTSTTQIIGNVLEPMTHKPALKLGTIGVQLGALTSEGNTPTMPDFLGFCAAARAAGKAGANQIVMEATSQGLHQGRLGDWQVDVAVFTNLTQDHLDYHGSMESYRHAKEILFDRHLKKSGTAVLNAEDPVWVHFAQVSALPSRTCIGFGKPEHNLGFFEYAKKKFFSARYLCIEKEKQTPHGIEGNWRLVQDQKTLQHAPYKLNLFGDFQHENLAAAAGALVALGYPLEQISKALSGTVLVPGRLEPVILSGQEHLLPTVLVDYAHSPDALEKTLATTRKIVPKGGKLVCVFGCGGDRDPGKRPLMGKIAATLADVCCLTSDNPRTEDATRIISDIEAGVPLKFQDKVTVIVERQEAIAHMIAHAGPNDVIVIAGKGHEDYQIIGTEKKPFLDATEARKALEARLLKV